MEGYIVCSVLGRSFDLQFFLENNKMNSLLHSFEMNLLLTLVCKAFKTTNQLPLLAFYRAIIYHKQGYTAFDSDKSAH
jgi:hypothetical protein